jgi:hypothetical protein
MSSLLFVRQKVRVCLFCPHIHPAPPFPVKYRSTFLTFSLSISSLCVAAGIQTACLCHRTMAGGEGEGTKEDDCGLNDR